MSNCLMEEFRAQLTTTMDSLLKMAMSDIMKIFENTLHDHQLELGQKGEEIAQLKIKLQSAEVKSTEVEQEQRRGAETKMTQRSELPKKQKNVNAPGQISNVPEIDFEVPDDWCAPLGCETVTKKQENMCPSIRMRQLYIPLWQVSLGVKAGNSDRILKKGPRKSSRNSISKECDKNTQTNTPVPYVLLQRKAVRNDMMKLLEEFKQESPELTDRRMNLRRRVRDSAGKEQEKTPKKQKKVGKIPAAESNKERSPVKEQEPVEHAGERRFSCKLCKKGFDTPIGLEVHIRSHKKCKGCKEEFGHLSDLKFHRLSCAKHRKMLSGRPRSSKPPNPPPQEEEKPLRPSKKQVTNTEESPLFSQCLSESSKPKKKLSIKHQCSHCCKKFDLRCRMLEHMRVHTGETPFHCSLCPMKFRRKQYLKKHSLKKHKGQEDPAATNGSLDWTMPLEAADGQEDLGTCP